VPLWQWVGFGSPQSNWSCLRLAQAQHYSSKDPIVGTIERLFTCHLLAMQFGKLCLLGLGASGERCYTIFYFNHSRRWLLPVLFRNDWSKIWAT